jgi:phage terminase large subunit-like protein
VLADLSGHYSPIRQTEVVVSAYHAWQADHVVCEVNNGGDYIPALVATVDGNVPVRAVTATRGKYIRAEPVSASYAAGRVHHVGFFPELEAQMCSFTPYQRTGSPDRLDALVWALTDLRVVVEALGWGDIYAYTPAATTAGTAGTATTAPTGPRVDVLWARAYQELASPKNG